MAAGPFEPIPADQRGVIGHGLLSADQYTLEAVPIGSPGTRGHIGDGDTLIYGGIDFNTIYGFPTLATGYLGFDDYQTSTAPGGSFGGGLDFMTHHFFVGGLSGTAPGGGVLFVTFFTQSGAPFDSYGVVLGDGLFYYGITITNGMYVPSSGVIQMWANDGSFTAFPAAPGTWFYSDGAPAVGTNNPAFGANAPNQQMHEIVIPAPASLAMLGLGGALAIRRRR